MPANPTASALLVPPEMWTIPRTNINARCWLTEVDGHCVVWVTGAPWHRFPAESKLDRRIVAANLVLAQIAKPTQVLRAFGLNRDTLYRDLKTLTEGGIPAMASLKRGPKGPSKVTATVRSLTQRYHREGLSNREIARRVGISEKTVRDLLGGKDCRHSQGEQQLLFTSVNDDERFDEGDADDQESNGEHGDGAIADGALIDEDTASTSEQKGDSASHIGGSEDGDCEAFKPLMPHPESTSERDLDRTVERVLARFGKISEADVRYVSGSDLQFVGALLIVPALVASGFFEVLEAVYGGLKNGFYGLRHTVLTVVFMLTLRISRVEQLAGVFPPALGRLLGIDRVPEVKTLRRRLGEISRRGKADEFMRMHAKRLAESDPDAVGFLHVDGHTRIYYGKRELSKAYSTRKRLALPAVTDFWINDMHGQPVFVVTGEVSQSLVQQILTILEELKQIIPEGVRVTFVFDRGGWSPKLFLAIVNAGHDFLTYRKGKYPKYPVNEFHETSVDIEGREVSFMLRDGVVRLGVGRLFRQVVRLDKKGKQVAIVTSRWDLCAAEVAIRIGDRWRQENFFKYAIEEFALDALDTYALEPDDPDRMVPNPERRKLNKEIRTIRKEAKNIEAQLGRAADANEDSRRPSMRGFKVVHASLRKKLKKTRATIEKLVARRAKTPKQVPVGEVRKQEAILLQVEHKHFMNAMKMAVYRAETGLFRLLDPHYRRSEDEGRKLLREAFESTGALEVTDGELRVTLSPMSAPRRTKAIAALCEEINAADVRIPGTTLRLRFSISRETKVSELAMGPCQEV